jgi:hypothetical protein
MFRRSCHCEEQSDAAISPLTDDAYKAPCVPRLRGIKGVEKWRVPWAKAPDVGDAFLSPP